MLIHNPSPYAEMRSLLPFIAAATHARAAASNVTVWNVVWVGGQSNSVATNSQTSGYPTWPEDPRIQMYCGTGNRCTNNTFATAAVPIYNELNVGFSLTYANLLLETLPPNEGVILVNTGVGGTGFLCDNEWIVPNGPLATRSVAVVQALNAALPAALGGAFHMHSFLWHQLECDGGDNRNGYSADYCTYLMPDLSALIDFFRKSFPNATNSTPFIAGGGLPYWVENVPKNSAANVSAAIVALNTSRVCTGTASSSIFPAFNPDGTPAGDPKYRSGASGMVRHLQCAPTCFMSVTRPPLTSRSAPLLQVIHFDATQQFFFGFEYWNAYRRALQVTSVVPSAVTAACGAPVQSPVASCG